MINLLLDNYICIQFYFHSNILALKLVKKRLQEITSKGYIQEIQLNRAN